MIKTVKADSVPMHPCQSCLPKVVGEGADNDDDSMDLSEWEDEVNENVLLVEGKDGLATIGWLLIMSLLVLGVVVASRYAFCF